MNPPDGWYVTTVLAAHGKTGDQDVGPSRIECVVSGLVVGYVEHSATSQQPSTTLWFTLCMGQSLRINGMAAAIGWVEARVRDALMAQEPFTTQYAFDPAYFAYFKLGKPPTPVSLRKVLSRSARYGPHR